jgi:hypothetical protein
MDYETTYIGNRNVWGGEKPFGISPVDRRQHLYVIGKTGTGKTTLLRNLICQDIERGHGVGVIDPHGDLAEELLDCIPSWRADDVVYFNPADSDFPVGFNLVRSSLGQRKYLEASSLVGAFKHIWRDSWGPRLEYILYASVAALLECENVSLLGLPRMLADARYRAWVLKQVRDPIVRSFWENEFARFDKRFLAETIAPIQNKVGQLLMAAPLRNIFGQVKSKIDPRFIMDNKRIFVANLSKGRLGEDKANLLGSLLVSKFQTAAMERADVPESAREDFYLFIDEFPNFSTESFASILSEARKYRLNLILSHQYIEQMGKEVKNAVFGNVGSLISFRLGLSDARVLANEFGSGYSPEHFTDLANHEIRAKLLTNGEYGEPFLAKTARPTASSYNRRANLMKRSRERFGTKRSLVETKIRRWFGH